MDDHPKLDINADVNYYAVYILNPDKYVSIHRNTISHGSSPDSYSPHSKSSDSEDSSGCLSLLEANLEAEQETVVRCHLLKNLPLIESAGFQNEGKYVTLKYSDEVKQPFGCYYHHLRKDCSIADGVDISLSEKILSRKVSFFICLIGKGHKEMESELGAFCCSFQQYLDPEGHQCQKGSLNKLQHWYFYCVKYIPRCIEKFKENLVILFQAALWGDITIECEDELLRSDLTRFANACSLNTLLHADLSGIQESDDIVPCKESMVEYSSSLVRVINEELVTEENLSQFTYCQKWVDRLLSCSLSDHVLMKSVLDSFCLKIVQDLNMLKRLLKKAENDYYSLYKAYIFLKSSGYEDALLHHVRQEAHLASNSEALRIIKCLDEYIKETKAAAKERDSQ